MKSVAIVYHSGYGHTAKAAQAVANGVSSVADVKVELIAVDAEGNVPEQTWATLNAADGIIFGTPTYMAGPSWQFKKFADASSKAWFTQQWKDKFFAGFTNSASMNGDKHETINYLMHLALQHSGLWVGMGLMPSNKKDANRNDVNYVANFSGLMTVSPSDSSPEEGPLPGDLETAKLFGARVATVVAKKA
jgi:NAD(P)H dehydrogenase (quinone)